MLAYLAPGFVLLWAAQQSLRFVGLSPYFQMENWAFESLVGLVLAFVIGQIVSARGRSRFEGRASWGLTPVFADGLISENFLLRNRIVKGQRLCSEPRRAMLISMATAHCGLSVHDADRLEGWEKEPEAAREISHRIYRPLLTLLADEKIGEKAHTMSVRYVFFRNLNVAAAYGGLLFMLCGGYNLSRHIPFADAKIALPVLLAMLSALTSVVSRREATHFAINHVREVFDSAHHFYSQRHTNKGAYVDV